MDFGERFNLNPDSKFYRTYPVVVESNSDKRERLAGHITKAQSGDCSLITVGPLCSYVIRTGNKHGSFFTWKPFLKDEIEAAWIHFHKTLFHFLESETGVFWDTERPDRDHCGASSYPVLEAGIASPKWCAEGNGWNICPAVPPPGSVSVPRD